MPQTSTIGTPRARYQRTSSGEIGAAPVTQKRARCTPISFRTLSRASFAGEQELQAQRRRRPAGRRAPCRRPGGRRRGPRHRPPAAAGPTRARAIATLGIELLPDPRHGREHRRRDLAHVLRHRLRVLDEVEHRAGVDGEVLAAEPLGDVAERQEAHPLVVLVLADDRVVAADRVDDAAVRVHRALGLAGRARGVDQDRQVVGAAGGGALVELARMRLRVLAAELAQRRRARAPAGRGSRAGPRCRRRRSSPARAGARAPPAPCRAARRPRRRSPGCANRRRGTRPGPRRRSGRCRSRRRRAESTARSASTHSTTVLARIDAVSPGAEAEREQAVADLAHRRGRARPGPLAPEAELLLPHEDAVGALRRPRSRTRPSRSRPARRCRAGAAACRRPRGSLSRPRLAAQRAGGQLIAMSSSSSSAARRARRPPSCRGRTP